ncbi:MAG: hypothetical protein AVDCRST_MAG64-1983, partial [uncultured Phycisphaerae bacterium]
AAGVGEARGAGRDVREDRADGRRPAVHAALRDAVLRLRRPARRAQADAGRGLAAPAEPAQGRQAPEARRGAQQAPRRGRRRPPPLARDAGRRHRQARPPAVHPAVRRRGGRVQPHPAEAAVAAPGVAAGRDLGEV